MADEKVIISEVAATEQDISAIRTEISNAGGGGAVRIDRLPYLERYALLEKSGIYTQRFGGTTRCIRTVELPERGGVTERYHCSRACVSVGDQIYCPEHDKAYLQPAQTPVPKGRVTNSASIPLTKGEAEEVSKISKSFTVVPAEVTQGPGRDRPATAPVVPLAQPVDRDSRVQISFTMDELSGGNLLKLFQDRMVAALDAQPCANVRQMKQIVALQSKLVKLGKARATKRGESNDCSQAI